MPSKKKRYVPKQSIQKENIPLDLRQQRSFNGLSVLSGQIIEDCNSDLVWPQCMLTYKMMMKDAVIEYIPI